MASTGTTLNDLANRCNKALSDQSEATWVDATIEQWLIEAIRHYSAHFPRLRKQTAQSCVADQHNYELPSDCIRVELVEYPVGEDPPDYLQLYSRKNRDFWGAEGYYDVEYYGQHDDTTTDMIRGQLWLSEDPATGETYQVTYWAPHRLDLSSGSVITVPDEHEHVLVLFVVWKAMQERLLYQMRSPDTTKSLIDSYRRSVNEARQAYDDAFRQARQATDHAGPTGPWKSDDWDRIY